MGEHERGMEIGIPNGGEEEGQITRCVWGERWREMGRERERERERERDDYHI